MLIGHFGVGLAAKRLSPRTSAGVLLAAAAGPDELFGIFSIFGVERAGPPAPWSHGLFMSAVWSLAVFGIALIITRRVRSSLIIAGVFFSHWLLDFISYPMGLGRPVPPDLPMFFDGSPLLGLGLYNWIAAALVTEIGLFAAGIALYLTGTTAIDRKGAWAFWVMIGYMVILPLVSAIVPPELAGAGCLAQLGLLPLGVWVDRHRGAKTPTIRAALRT
jgi:hypothetical protein